MATHTYQEHFIHVREGNNVAKYWILPFVSLADSWGFTGKEQNELESIVIAHPDLIEEKWNEYFK